MTTANLIYVMAISTVKLIIAVPLALQLDFSFWQATLVCFIGGCIGVVFFAFFFQKVTDIFRKYFPKKEKPKTENKKESFKDKLVQKARKKYGLVGLAFLTPVFLSIPFGTFITISYYPNKRKTIPYLFISVFLWSLGMSLFTFL